MKFLLILMIFVMVTDGARRANEAYEKGDFAAAEQAYLEAIRENPDDARLYFNLGNALARQGKFDEAVTAYERFKERSDNPDDRARADYNIGNIFGSQEKWDRAANQFRESLRNNPDDAEAKYNFELANRLLQEQQQNQESSPDQQNQDQGDDQQDQQQQQQQGNEDGKQDQQDSEQDQQQNQEQQQQGSQEQQQRPQPQTDMTRDEANRILNALDNKEQDLLKNYHKNQVPSTTRHAKNW